MVKVRTAEDVGNVIRERRKALGWDQARLANDCGVSRQWVIDIEKGKPRAELQLVLRAMNVLGLKLAAISPQAGSDGTALPKSSLDEILDRHRQPPVTRPSANRHGKAVSYAEILERARVAVALRDGTIGPSVDAAPENSAVGRRRPAK